jgi:hypothetical protein
MKTHGLINDNDIFTLILLLPVFIFLHESAGIISGVAHGPQL